MRCPSLLILALASASLLATWAQAGDLRAPFDLESTSVLPKGIRNPRFKNVMSWMDEKYSGGGAAEPLGVKLNKTVTWDELVRNQKGDDRVTLEGLLAAGNYGSSAGRATGNVSTFAYVKAPVLAWGFTETWTSAVAVPVASIDISASTGFVRSAEAQALLDEAYKSDPEKARTAAAKLNDPAQEKLRIRGYEPIRSMSVTHVGDISWVNKVLLRKSDVDAWGVKQTVVIPTGAAPNPDRAIDPATGDGQWDLGFAVSYDRKLRPNLKWNSTLGYTLQLGDEIVKRIPESFDESLSYDKQLVSRKLGNVTSFGTSLTYEFGETGFSVGGGYNFQYMARASYDPAPGAPVETYDEKSGWSQSRKQIDRARYDALEALSPEQLLHSGVISAGYSGINAYRAKRVPIPFQVNVSFSKPLRGINTSNASLTAAELVLFF